MRVQQALDLVRVVGNSAVHPGHIDLKDDVGTAMMLFGWINVIAEDQISEPKRIEELYQQSLTPGQKEHIEQRDGKG